MELSQDALKLRNQVNDENTKLGDLRKIAKEIKRDHELAMELWSTQELMPRKLAILIMDKRLLTQEVIDQFDKEMKIHSSEEQNHLADWLMANQLQKDKKTIALMQSWANSPSDMQRRLYWYYQARLRWTGQTPPENTADLLTAMEANIINEVPGVQWAVNFTAGWIGVFDEANRKRCIQLGEQTQLFKDEIVPKNCTPNYLPEFIRIEVGKRQK